MKKEKQHTSHERYMHKKYAKKYRKRHYISLIIFSLLTIVSLVFLGSSFSKNILVVDNQTSQPVPVSRLQRVSSSIGFGFDIPSDKYKVFTSTTSNSPLLVASPPYVGDFNKAQLKSSKNVVGNDGFAKLTVEKKSKRDYDQTFARKKTELEAIKELLSSPVTGFTVAVTSTKQEKLNDQEFQVFEYELTPTQLGADNLYAKKWARLTNDGLYVISADDLTSVNQAESEFAVPLKTIQIGEQPKLIKLSGSIFSNSLSAKKSDSVSVDQISPSVVKIYHFVCGELILDGQQLTDNTCDGNVGSGFFVSNDGKVATNGHVVTLTPADFLINIVSSSPENTRILLNFMGVSTKDINSENQDKLAASLMTKLHNLPADRLKINNYRELTVVAMGSEPLKFSSVDDVKRLLDFKNSDQLAKARLIARDYSAKDIASLNQQGSSGFSASDVALLQLDTANTPYIGLANTDQTDVNSKINVIGFPSDAENELTENDRISPTVTSGTISAKRSANGATGRLFQSDVDASQGNSGGPAVDEQGQVIGLLTYRYKDETNSNAAKSYIRDINDIIALAKTNNIILGGENKTYNIWQTGLDKYKKEHYSASIGDFAKVQSLFPAHRLVNDYATKANQAVREGKDKPLLSVDVIALAVTAFLGITGVVVFSIMIHRHRLGHHIHKSLKNQDQH